MQDQPAGPPIKSEFATDPDMRELVEEFVDALPGRVNDLMAAFEAGDLETVTRGAHQLSGASGGYGFPAVGDVARAFEHRLKALDSAEQLESLRNDVDGLVAMCGRVVL
ncbi:MAG: Hpt domain-containing protein [Planctomycetota bacterium]